jgi:hypothetical protein
MTALVSSVRIDSKARRRFPDDADFRQPEKNADRTNESLAWFSPPQMQLSISAGPSGARSFSKFFGRRSDTADLPKSPGLCANLACRAGARRSERATGTKELIGWLESFHH